MATPIWNDKEERWTLRVTRDGRTRKFTSVKPGLAGKKAVLASAREFSTYGSTAATVKEVRDAWLLDIKARLGDQGTPYKHAEILTRLFVLPVLGKRKIKDVKLREWQSCINEARPHRGTGELSKKYLSNIRATIIQMTKWAYENDYMDPLKGSLYVPAGRPVVGKQVLSPTDVKRLLEPSDEWYWPAWCLMVLTGMRPGEVYGLQIDDFDGMNVTIRRSINDRGQITEGKNRNARRTVPLHPYARDLIKNTIKRNEYLKTRWIFPNRSGGSCVPATVIKDWHRFADARNIPGTPYSLRHTFVSMVKTTMPEPLLKALVGHSATMDTFGVYGHHMDGDDEKTITAIDTAFM